MRRVILQVEETDDISGLTYYARRAIAPLSLEMSSLGAGGLLEMEYERAKSEVDNAIHKARTAGPKGPLP